MSVITPQGVSRSRWLQVGWGFMLLGAMLAACPRLDGSCVSACGSERRARRAILCADELGSLQLGGSSFDVAFPIVAWSSWVLNGLVAEMWLRRR